MNNISRAASLLVRQRRWTPEQREKQRQIMAEARKHIKPRKTQVNTGEIEVEKLSTTGDLTIT